MTDFAIPGSGALLGNAGLSSTSISNCNGLPFTSGSLTWPSSYPYYSHEKTMGSFDLHLDRCGNLRVIRDGVQLAIFEAKK